jgi:type IV secretory pathway VirB2 component (pilin)
MNIIQWIIITAGYAAVVFIIVGGFMYMTAQGEPSKIAEAKKSITNAIIGLVVALAAVMIVRTVQGAISGSIV